MNTQENKNGGKSKGNRDRESKIRTATMIRKGRETKGDESRIRKRESEGRLSRGRVRNKREQKQGEKKIRGAPGIMEETETKGDESQVKGEARGNGMLCKDLK